MTQFTVEVVTIILLLLALNFLPKETVRVKAPVRRTRDVVMSLLAGLGIVFLAIIFDRIAQSYGRRVQQHLQIQG
jgi:multicomponent K+:H+ antiporter subunit A